MYKIYLNNSLRQKQHQIAPANTTTQPGILLFYAEILPNPPHWKILHPADDLQLIAKQ